MNPRTHREHPQEALRLDAKRHFHPQEALRLDAKRHYVILGKALHRHDQLAKYHPVPWLT